MNRSISFLTVLLAAAGYGATIDSVVVRQQWPWNVQANIDYVISDVSPESPADIRVTAYAGSQLLGEISSAALTGPRQAVTAAGEYRLVFDPTKTDFTNRKTINDFRIVLTPVASASDTNVLYKIVNLVSGAVTDVTRGQICSGSMGSWRPNDITNSSGEVIESVVWTEVTNHVAHPEYCSTNLVLRRIPHGDFMMNGTNVTLTQDFYLGVFEVTQLQWQSISNSTPSYFTNPLYVFERPVERVTYNAIRGASLGSHWPANNAVDTDSFMGLLRAKTGKTFDLPTQAQWVYACQAKTTSDLNSGKNCSDNTNPEMNEVGRYRGNTTNYKVITQNDALDNGSNAVGSYRPNAWGLYDMHGNVWEFCLDWTGVPPSATVDPVGAASASPAYRCRQGGGWSHLASFAKSSFYSGCTNPTWPDSSVGFRLMMPAD